MTHPSLSGHSSASLLRARILSLLCLLPILAAACGVRQAAQISTPFILVTVPADATPTVTPFQPDQFLVLTPVAAQAQPAAALIPQPAGQVSIILLGSDQRPGQGDFRTDVLMLVTIKTDRSVSIVSFPRDLYIYIPGQGMDRINTAMEFGDFELLKAALEYNFGVSPQSYILTNFSGFKSIVDSLGGLDVNVGQAFHDARTGYSDGFTVNPGLAHMDGDTALWYVRSRKSSSDFDRLRRAQEVIVAASLKLFNLNALGRVPELYAAYRSAVVTDLTLDDALQLLPLLQTIDTARVDRYTINTDQATPWTDPDNGAYYLLPNPDAIRQLLQQAIGVSSQ